MTIKSQPMGPYQTNCYIVSIDNKDFIIDPGVDATSWVVKNVKNPIAILNTHGHFDHVWSNSEVAQELNIPIYCPNDDCFMLLDDPFSQGTPKSKPNFKVQPNQAVDFDGVKVMFHHFPGHTPGSSAIEIKNALFSGDFIFQGSIGRVDFPYSSPNDMKKSITKVLNWKNDFEVYPGHGDSTNLKNEKDSLKAWLNYI